MIDLMIISGPTGVGKTNISIELAKKLQGEIISADSMQIYKEMDIGSAKISPKEMQGVSHFMLDVISPEEEFSAAGFKEVATKNIEEINKRNHLPILVGGTGLYINSLIFNYEFTGSFKDEEYRTELIKLSEEKGKEYVHSLLKEVDLESYEKLYPNDLKRVVRALEVYKLSGKPISLHNANTNAYDIPYRLHYFVLTMDREQLYARINQRVDIMLEQGLVEEVIKLKEKGYNANMQSMKGIGYKEILYYLDNKITYEEAVEMIKQGSRNYAKRQLTWFRKDPRAIWIDKDNFESDEKIIEEILKTYYNKINQI